MKLGNRLLLAAGAISVWAMPTAALANPSCAQLSALRIPDLRIVRTSEVRPDPVWMAPLAQPPEGYSAPVRRPFCRVEGTIEDEIAIMEQEAKVELDGEFPVVVPYFMREIIEQVSMAARKSKFVDQASGVSARLSLANYRTMVASARQRGALLNEKPAVPRISDLGHLYSSSLGKLELDMMGSHQMTERQVLDAVLAQAIATVFAEPAWIAMAAYCTICTAVEP